MWLTARFIVLLLRCFGADVYTFQFYSSHIPVLLITHSRFTHHTFSLFRSRSKVSVLHILSPLSAVINRLELFPYIHTIWFWIICSITRPWLPAVPLKVMSCAFVGYHLVIAPRLRKAYTGKSRDGHVTVHSQHWLEGWAHVQSPTTVLRSSASFSPLIFCSPLGSSN